MKVPLKSFFSVQQLFFSDNDSIDPKAILAILTFLVTIAVMICCFSLMAMTIKRMRKSIRKTEQRNFQTNEEIETKKRITRLNKLAVWDCVIFVLVHLPFTIARVIPGEENHVLDTISNIIMWSASSIYPLIYISHWGNLKQDWERFLICKSKQSDSYELAQQ